MNERVTFGDTKLAINRYTIRIVWRVSGGRLKYLIPTSRKGNKTVFVFFCVFRTVKTNTTILWDLSTRVLNTIFNHYACIIVNYYTKKKNPLHAYSR